MDPTARTPGWMVGLLIIFSLATAATFGLFLFHHAERAALTEQHSRLSDEVKEMRGHAGALDSQVAPLDNQIAMRRTLSKNLADADAQAINDVERLVSQDQLGVKAIGEAMAKQIKPIKKCSKKPKNGAQNWHPKRPEHLPTNVNSTNVVQTSAQRSK